MEDYSVWADLLASYRASPDFAKLLLLLVPLVLSLGVAAVAIGVALRLTAPRRGASVRAVPETTCEMILLDAAEPAPPPLLPPPPLER
jgi:hypothetical protein